MQEVLISSLLLQSPQNACACACRVRCARLSHRASKPLTRSQRASRGADTHIVKWSQCFFHCTVVNGMQCGSIHDRTDADIRHVYMARRAAMAKRRKKKAAKKKRSSSSFFRNLRALRFEDCVIRAGLRHGATSAMQLLQGAPVPMMTEGVSEACSLADALAVLGPKCLRAPGGHMFSLPIARDCTGLRWMISPLARVAVCLSRLYLKRWPEGLATA